jgi:hypothetical protein
LDKRVQRQRRQRQLGQHSIAENQNLDYAAPMGMIEHFSTLRGLDLIAPSVGGAKGRANFISAKIPRNPLIRLDSSERIQGNPSFSNPKIRRFRNETARRQENPNRV